MRFSERERKGKSCSAIDGILEEDEEILDDFKDSAALDAGLISAAQAMEHHEINDPIGPLWIRMGP